MSFAITPPPPLSLSRTVPQKCCQLQQDAHLLKQEHLQRSLETVRCVGTGYQSHGLHGQLVPKLWAGHRTDLPLNTFTATKIKFLLPLPLPLPLLQQQQQQQEQEQEQQEQQEQQQDCCCCCCCNSGSGSGSKNLILVAVNVFNGKSFL